MEQKKYFDAVDSGETFVINLAEAINGNNKL
jgi:hypothetical protein